MRLHINEKLRSANTYSPFLEKSRGCNGPDPRQLPDYPEMASSQECILTRGGYSIRLVNSHRLCGEVSTLIRRMYSWRGYQTESMAVSSHNPNRLTFEATIEQQLVGTLTLGIDSEEGLLADELYSEEINAFRARDRKICELSKLAVDTQYSSKEILASLFHLAYIYGRNIHKSTDLFIEVNPRHVGFYKRMLGLGQVGNVRTCRRVNAPAVLMHLELDYVDTQIASFAGSCKSSERSLYPYFFSKHEEKRLAKKLQRYND